MNAAHTAHGNNTRVPCRRPDLPSLSRAIPLACVMAVALTQQANAQPAAMPALAVETPAFANGSLKRHDAIEIRLSREVTPQEGEIAICIGPLDLSRQTKRIAEGRYRAEAGTAVLPGGVHDVVVHLIRGEEWLDIAKFRVTVDSDAATNDEGKGIESRFTLAAKGQLHERVSGNSKPGARAQFQDLNATGALSWEGKPLGWDAKTSANFTGVSRRNDAPRFGTEGVNAEKIDLNDYKVELARGDAKLALGHVSYGSHPLLLHNRDSRGLTVGYVIAPWLDVSASALRATSVVGFDDLFGLATVDHRIYATTLGAELLSARKGLLRAELTFMDARAQPQTNVNQGQIPDAEESRGLGLRVVSSDPDGRWKADAQWARSRYVNPTHPDLAQGSTLVAVKPETRDAMQAEAMYLLVKDAKWLGERYPLNLRTIAHYEYAEPLFKSLGASFLADQQLRRYTAEARAGDIAFTLTGSEKNDNVRSIPTILKTGTYEYAAQLNLPLPTLFGSSDKPASLWPQAQFESKRVRQYTLRIPDGTSAKSSFWPDQLNYSHKAALNWNHEPVTVGYTLEIADQDNRQPGREQADFLIHAHGLTLAWKVNDKLNVNLAYNRSRNYSYEKSQASYNHGGTLGVDWQFADVWSVKVDYAKALAFDSLSQQYSNTLTAALQLARKFTLEQFGKKLPGQVFVRVAYAHNRALDTVIAQVLSGKQTLVQTGLSINF